MSRNLLLCFLSALVIQFTATAQDSLRQERGEIQDAEFIIRKDRVLTLPQHPRVFEKIPVLPRTEEKREYSYEAKNFHLDLKPVVTDTQPSQKGFAPNKPTLYHSFVKLGYGNYQSPLGELYINNVESDYVNYGFSLKHQGFYQGPVDGKNSAESHTRIRLDGSIFQEEIEFFGNLGYNQDKYHFYGYTPVPGIEVLPDDIGQVLHTIQGNVGLRKINKEELFNYAASLSLRLFNDNYRAREHEVGIKASAGLRARDGRFRGGVDAEAYISSPSDATYADFNRQYVKFFPYLAYGQENFNITAGANLVVENDIIPDKTSDFHIFPSLKASYHLSESFGLYAEAEGDVLRRTYFDFVMENPFLGPSDQLRNTVQKIQVDAGIMGAVNDALSYKTGIRFGEFENMHFFGNHLSDSTRFQLVYDGLSQVLNYHVSVGWKYENWYKLQASANYYYYELSDIGSPWHRPEWEIDLDNAFMPGDKWIITANANLLGGIQAINFQSGQTTDLKAIIDLSAGVDYSFTPRFSAFVKGHNLLNQNYERYWNYRVRGIQGIGGISFKF